MNEQQQARVLAEWLERGGPPPEGLDPEVLASVYALRPELAPEPELSADDILADLTEGPLAPAPFDLEEAFDEAFQEAAAEIIDLGSRRRVRPVAWAGGLAAAAVVMLALRAGTLAPEAPTTVEMAVPLDGGAVPRADMEALDEAEAPVLAEEMAAPVGEAGMEAKREADDRAAPAAKRAASAPKAKSAAPTLGTADGLGVGGIGGLSARGSGSSAGALGAAGRPTESAPVVNELADDAAPVGAAAPPVAPAAGQAPASAPEAQLADEAEEEQKGDFAEEDAADVVVEAPPAEVAETVAVEEIAATSSRRQRKSARESRSADAPAASFESAEVRGTISATSMSAEPTIDQALAHSSDIAKGGNPGAAARYLQPFIKAPAVDGQQAGLRAVRYALEARQPALARRLADKAIDLDPASETATRIRELLQESP